MSSVVIVILVGLAIISIFFLGYWCSLKKLKSPVYLSIDNADTYLGKLAQVVVEINTFTGRITIYGETWEARTREGTAVIECGQWVRLQELDNLTFIVKSEEK